MISKTKIEKRMQRKTSSELASTILACKKNTAWNDIGKLVSNPKRNRIIMNLDEINKTAKDNETIILPGKVLSQGEITKKIKIIALNFSESAREKLSKAKIEISSINEEIKKNPKLQGVKILK
ncbi:MAG: 50S ribosomal protein L18e [archaeon]|nr:50S ribosomal protein L18e [archaeon]